MVSTLSYRVHTIQVLRFGNTKQSNMLIGKKHHRGEESISERGNTSLFFLMEHWRYSSNEICNFLGYHNRDPYSFISSIESTRPLSVC